MAPKYDLVSDITPKKTNLRIMVKVIHFQFSPNAKSIFPLELVLIDNKVCIFYIKFDNTSYNKNFNHFFFCNVGG